MSKYLYGAAVQGIQSYIFQSNELKEIVGASEIVEQICTTFFNEMVTDQTGTIQQAAGKILHVFEGDNAKEDCQKVVRLFPHKVMTHAPGITISQGVVNMEEYNTFEKAVNKLEEILKIQRNKPINSITCGLMGIERSRTTGLPVMYNPLNNDEHIDYGTWNKLYEKTEEKSNRRRTTKILCKKAFGTDITDGNIPYDIEQITAFNDWIAIIHADGNGMGQVVQKVGKDPKEFHDFSINLNHATIRAANLAFEDICNNCAITTNPIPIRPIVLSGDDHTIICRGDLAIPYAKAFLQHFEEQTKEKLGSIIERNNVFPKGDIHDCLTACAGIAFVKSSFPFYSAYDLAESLCSQAKKDAKNSDEIRSGNALPQSCLMFFKVQDSFGFELKEMIDRDLHPNNHTGFDYGPYYLQKHDSRMTIQEIVDMAKNLGETEDGNAVKSSIRQWISLMFEDEGKAEQKLKRIKEMTPKGLLKTISLATTPIQKNSSDDLKYYPAYDMLIINTVNNLRTI